MKPDRWAELARYNAERARGVVHTAEWVARMEAQQREFDAERRADHIARGGVEAAPGLWVMPRGWLRKRRWWHRLA